ILYKNMATKKNSFIKEDLDWLKNRAQEIKDYIDANPYHKISDRIEVFETTKGPADKLIASIETQQKAQREALKDYALILEAIDKLEQIEEKKNNVRGGDDLTPLERGDI